MKFKKSKLSLNLVFISINVLLIFILKSNLFESVTKMLVPFAKSTILYHYLSYLASHFYRKEKTKGQELSLAGHHFFSLPIWKIYDYLLHYPLLLFDIFVLEKIWSMFRISHQFHKILILLILKRYKGNLKQNITIHGHNTRSKLNLHVQFCNTVLFQKSLVNMGYKLYNNVPESIKKLDKLRFFTKRIKILNIELFLLLSWWVFTVYSKESLYICTRSLVIINRFITVILMYLNTVLYWTVYQNYCFIKPYGYLDNIHRFRCIYIVIVYNTVRQVQCYTCNNTDV